LIEPMQELLRLVRSFSFGLAAGVIALSALFAYGWSVHTHEPEMGWLGTYSIFALMLAIGYFAFFCVLAVPFFRIVRNSGRGILPIPSMFIGACIFALASAVCSYFNNGRSFGDFGVFACLAAVSGAATFYGWHRN
jgi:hypothetical protein